MVWVFDTQHNLVARDGKGVANAFISLSMTREITQDSQPYKRYSDASGFEKLHLCCN
jgi:hypothetical protein